MVNKRVVQFIKESREKGYEDFQLRDILAKNKWPQDEIESAFETLKPKFKFKNKVEIFLSNEILNKLQKRADKNMFTITEQIEDILRRSISSQKTNTIKPEKLDDKFILYFSRKK